MRKIWVVILSVVAFTVGAFATMAYSAANSGIASFRIGCALLDKAETMHLLTREQRSDVVDRVHENLQRSLRKRDADLESRFGKFKTGCPVPPSR
jgi:hypothetical protein